MTMEWADGLGWSGRQNDRLDEPYKTRQKSRESVQGVRRYCCHIIYISHSNYTNPCSNPQQLQHKDDSPGCKAGRLKKEERSSVMFLSSGGQQVLQFACAHQRNSCVDASVWKSGLETGKRPGPDRTWTDQDRKWSRPVRTKDRGPVFGPWQCEKL